MKAPPSKSKAVLAVDLQSENQCVSELIESLRDTTTSLLDSEKPSKQQRKLLFDAVTSLLLLQTKATEKIPALVPGDVTQYSMKRLSTVKAHEV